MATKIQSAFFCNNCGYQSPKWLGKCPSCTEWNSFVEEIIEKTTAAKSWQPTSEGRVPSKAIPIQSVVEVAELRIKTPDEEINRVLGGGIVSGSIVLIAGEPGIGKSTLFLQLGLQLQNYRTLYISGEESMQQIKMRADRIGFQNPNFYLLTETNIQNIFTEIKRIQPQLVIIDSIQTLQTNLIEASAGSVSQIKECASEFQKYAKETQTPVFLIGHITKDGNIAGPKILEHMVDTVLHFEGDRHYAYRIIRTLKNRFGSSAELGIYEMMGNGMRVINNPSEILIAQKDVELSGSAIAATIEGIRPLLIEVQALVTQSVYGTPQRTSTGFDLRRLQLLLAVLEKRGGFHFGVKDVFVNIAGGLKIEDPSIDLAIVCALLSSYEDIPIDQRICFAGEVGLNGEIRAVNKIEQRISEAAKLGFKKIFISKYNKKQIDLKITTIKIVEVGQLQEVYTSLFVGKD